MSNSGTHPGGEIRTGPLASQADADAFRSLNEEWIVRLFHMEEKDRLTLNDPQTTIVDKGGQVYLARDAADDVIGCAALIPFGDGLYELSKMAVAPEARGKGVGRKLLLAVLDEARQMGARSVFLGSSTRLHNAVHLYEAVGFRHVSPDQLPPMKYDRADVFMKLDL